MMFVLYELYCPGVDESYVGVTGSLETLLTFHKYCSFSSDRPLYVFIREHGGWYKWCCRILETRESHDEIIKLKFFGSLNERVKWRVPTIYKIFCLDSTVTEVYVGKTINFDERYWAHFTRYANGDTKLYKFICEHGGWDNWHMEKVGVYPYASDYELDHLEYIWWKRLGGQLNMKVPGCKKISFRGDDEEFCQIILTNGCRDSFIKHGIFLDI